MDNEKRSARKGKEYVPEQSVRFQNHFAWESFDSSIGFTPNHSGTNRVVSTMHRHPFIQLWFCCRGVYRHAFEDGEFVELGAGSLVIVPPYCAHALDLRNDVDVYHCDMRLDFLLGSSDETTDDSIINTVFLAPVLANAKQIQPIYYFSDETSAEIERLLNEICVEYEKKDSFSLLLMRANTTRIFALIAKEYALSGQDKRISAYRDALYSALKYMHEHYMEKLYLEDVAKIAAMNRQTFSYLFKELMGMTFSKYIQYLRVLHAKDLLSSSNRTQQDISDALGFRGTPFFQKVFKEFTGILPGQFRAKNANDE